MATIAARIAEFYRRLGSLSRANSADEALEQLSRVLDEVEDELSGIPKKTPPPSPKMGDGRMYPPLADHTLKHPGGGLTAITRGHIIRIGNDGGMAIMNKRTGAVEFQK